MPTCRVVRPLLSDAADGQLPWWKAAMVRFHLFICPPCRRLDRSLHRTLGVLAELSVSGQKRDPSDPADPRRP